MSESIPVLLPAVDRGDPKRMLLKIQLKFNQSIKTFGLLKGTFEYRKEIIMAFNKLCNAVTHFYCHPSSQGWEDFV